MELKVKLKFHIFYFILFFIHNRNLAECGELNNMGIQYENTSSFSIAPLGLCYFPFCYYKPGENQFFCDTFVFNEIYWCGEIELCYLLQSSFWANKFNFFPFVGLDFQFCFLKYYISRYVSSLLNNKKVITGNERYNPFLINLNIIFEPETNLDSKFRCCQQLGIGLSWLNINRCPKLCNLDNSKIEKLNLSRFDICFLHKIKFKIKPWETVEFVISLGYTYNPFILCRLFGSNSLKYNTNIEPGLFNFFFILGINFLSNIGDETVDWFNDSVTYERIENKMKIQASLPLLFWGKCYSNSLGQNKQIQSDANIIDKLFTGFYLNLSYPYLFSFSKIHYLGFYIDGNLSFPELFLNSNITAGVSITSDYKTLIFEHNFGLYLLTNNGLFGQKEISSIKPADKEAKPTFFSNRFVYRPRLHFDIIKIFRLSEKYNIPPFIKKMNLVVGVNIMLYTSRNDKTCEEVNNKKNVKYIPAQIESVFIGISF